jgi:hypothetical protein
MGRGPFHSVSPACSMFPRGRALRCQCFLLPPLRDGETKGPSYRLRPGPRFIPWGSPECVGGDELPFTGLFTSCARHGLFRLEPIPPPWLEVGFPSSGCRPTFLPHSGFFFPHLPPLLPCLPLWFLCGSFHLLTVPRGDRRTVGRAPQTVVFVSSHIWGTCCRCGPHYSPHYLGNLGGLGAFLFPGDGPLSQDPAQRPVALPGRQDHHCSPSLHGCLLCQPRDRSSSGSAHQPSSVISGVGALG